MVCAPAESALVVKTAVPAAPSATGPPSVAAPSVKVTVPAVTGEPLLVTVAVNAIDSPKVDVGGFALTWVALCCGNEKYATSGSWADTRSGVPGAVGRTPGEPAVFAAHGRPL